MLTIVFILILSITTSKSIGFLKPDVVGGEEAELNSWPSQILIEQSYKTEYDFKSYGNQTIAFKIRCGGTLLNKTHILTAAHCIAKFTILHKFDEDWKVDIVPNNYYTSFEDMFKLYAGAHNVSFTHNSEIPIPETVKLLRIKNFYIHPSYNTENKQNDIAILEITPEVTETDEIKYALLPEKSTTIPSMEQRCTVIGWGKLGEFTGNSDMLMEAFVDVLDMKINCSKYNANEIKQICAGYSKKDSCQGDSGGGLYLIDENTNKWLTIGIVSYGFGCARPGFPGIYTRISAYIDWIKYRIE